MALALERTAMMLDSYPDRADVPNAGAYVGTIAAVLATYPEEVIMAVTDPARGLQTRQTFRPRAAEVREACEAEMAPIRRQAERERIHAESQRLLAAPAEERPTIDEIKSRLGDNYGIKRVNEKPAIPIKSHAELLEYRTAEIEVSDELKAMLSPQQQERTA